MDNKNFKEIEIQDKNFLKEKVISFNHNNRDWIIQFQSNYQTKLFDKKTMKLIFSIRNKWDMEDIKETNEVITFFKESLDKVWYGIISSLGLSIVSRLEIFYYDIIRLSKKITDKNNYNNYDIDKLINSMCDVMIKLFPEELENVHENKK